jgi:hypothetical protein
MDFGELEVRIVIHLPVYTYIGPRAELVRHCGPFC